MKWTFICCSILLGAASPAGWLFGQETQALPNTGQTITPTAPRNARYELLNPGLADFPQYNAGQAATTVISPDKKTLLILTSGYNRLNDTTTGRRITADSNEYVFVYDISTKIPLKKQVLQVPNTYYGMAMDPSGATFYVAGGVSDNIHIFDLTAGVWAERAGSPIALGHTAGVGNGVSPAAAGIAISADGKKLVVANYYNDSLSVLTNTDGSWGAPVEQDLRPGKIDPANASGVPGGEYPFWVAIKGDATAFVSSIRDREVDVVDISGVPTLTHRIKVPGQPNKMTFSPDQGKLYVAEDQTDSVGVVDTVTYADTEEIKVGAPLGLIPAGREKFTGHNTNSVTVSPDGNTLYATNGNMNDVAVVDLSNGTVKGLIPTGWYPNSVGLSADGSYIYVASFKTPTGANPGYCYGGVVPALPSAQCNGSNQYDLQLIHAGFQSFPTPNARQLATLTETVAANNHWSRQLTAAEQAKIDFLRGKIKHVVLIIKENKTYDQILGDLAQGNGDPDLTEFGESITPNEHSLANNFVTLDNFFDRSEVSMDGWPWTVDAEDLDVVEHQTSVEYAGRGLTYDSEGDSRNVNVGLPTLAQRLAQNPSQVNDPDVLPGTVDITAPDGPNGKINKGHIWDAALRAGKTVRNYGMFVDIDGAPEDRTPFADHTVVAHPTNEALMSRTDRYFRGFDTAYPEFYREKEWAREFAQYEANGELPNLILVRMGRDHMGSFSSSLDGTDTPETQVADNDYSVGLLVQTITKSKKYGKNTLVFSIEDDAQNGGDHVDAHRSIAFVAGPYVKQGKVISTPYNTVDMIRTIVDILGAKPFNLNVAVATPMTNVFETSSADWTFIAQPSSVLATTQLPIDPVLFALLRPVRPKRDSAYWADATKGMDFTAEDRIDFNLYNHILWEGLMGGKPYPTARTRKDLRQNRSQMLQQFAHQQSGQTNGAGGGL
ncbi:MAG TPA: beta-propeller fold lactonase family protein [Bryobacteraceae bacterium]|jgi:YVTN family beta-propeller protein